jgi:L-threonylcarbamoyladenylate synthase
MNVLEASPENIKTAAEVLSRGGLVAFPTETVYGLGADALNPAAVVKIFEVKNRPRFDPIIVHIAEAAAADRLAALIPREARGLMEAFWPGPLTLVLPKKETVPGIVTAGLDTVAIRMPDHPVALELIRQAGRPVGAPSANPFGFLSPTSAGHVHAQLGEKIEIILDGGSCSIGVESTILGFDEGGPVLLRPGGLSLEEIEKLAGAVRVEHGESFLDPQAPGMLRHHYSPRTPLRVIRDVSDVDVDTGNAGLLAFTAVPREPSFTRVEVLSSRGDLREAAMNLFSCLHRLDREGLEVIFAESVPETGLGRAIMNRLRKAAGIARG